VKAVLVNIFAGINRCDWVAQGVVERARDRHQGSAGGAARRPNVEAGRKIIEESGIAIISASTLKDAATRPSPPARKRDELTGSREF